MLIVGVTGRKRHGKDTVASKFVEQGFQKLAFADPLKAVARDMYSLTWDELYGPDYIRETVIPRYGKSSRQILQLLGTEVGRTIYEDTWVRLLVKNVRAAQAGLPHLYRDDERKELSTDTSGRPPKGIVIPDVRFPNEADAIARLGGIIVKVVRSGMADTDTHASELGVDSIRPDCLVYNSSTLAAFELQIASLLNTVRDVR